jgi:hypothetical protein
MLTVHNTTEQGAVTTQLATKPTIEKYSDQQCRGCSSRGDSAHRRILDRHIFEPE